MCCCVMILLLIIYISLCVYAYIIKCCNVDRYNTQKKHCLMVLELMKCLFTKNILSIYKTHKNYLQIKSMLNFNNTQYNVFNNISKYIRRPSYKCLLSFYNSNCMPVDNW